MLDEVPGPMLGPVLYSVLKNPCQYSQYILRILIFSILTLQYGILQYWEVLKILRTATIQPNFTAMERNTDTRRHFERDLTIVQTSAGSQRLVVEAYAYQELELHRRVGHGRRLSNAGFLNILNIFNISQYLQSSILNIQYSIWTSSILNLFNTRSYWVLSIECSTATN